VSLADAQRGVRALPIRGGEAKRLLSMLAALRDLGWQRSAREGQPVTATGQPLPWYTYAAVSWLGPRLRPVDRVFEFGSGNSTLWFAQRVKAVVSVEHDPTWAARVRARLPANAELLVRADPGPEPTAPEGDAYVSALSESAKAPYDVIVVDGRARVSCMAAALQCVVPDGLVVLDNADRPSLRPAHELAGNAGFGRIDFLGPVPGSGRLSVTSVFSSAPSRWLEVDAPLPQVGY
jgi:hypothetical protein